MNDFHIVVKSEPIGYELGGPGSLNPALGSAFLDGCVAADCHVDQGMWKRCVYPDPAWLRERLAELESDTPRRAQFVESLARRQAWIAAFNEHRMPENREDWVPPQEEVDRVRPGVLDDLPGILDKLRQFVACFEKEFESATDWTPVPGDKVGHRYPYVRLYLG
jgi:hypothetical protein